MTAMVVKSYCGLLNLSVGKITENMRMVDDFCINITMPLHVSFYKKKWKLYARFANVVRFMNRISNILSFMARNLFSIVIMSPSMAWWCIGK